MSDDGGLGALIEAIASASGLAPRDDWAMLARRGLVDIAERRGTSVEALIAESSTWSDLLPDLLDHLTVRETYFFRQPTHFDFLVEALRARFALDPMASPCILSAGCATGEEPYSLAIAVHTRLGAEPLQRLRILASDISPEAIRRAREGIYGAWAFRDAPAWLTAAYFRPEPRGARLDQVIRQSVAFSVGHAVSHAATLPSSSVDAVVFRNVGIYLSPSAVADVYREFHRVLRPGGLLVLAPADPRPGRPLFADAGHESTSIYARTAPAEPEIPPVPSSRRGRRASHALRSPHAAPHARPSRATPRPTPAAPLKAQAAPPRPAASDHGGATREFVTAIHALERGEPEAALEDLRRLLFLRSDHRLARYWYVLALQGAGLTRQALTQARALEAQLDACAPEDLLEDAETTAAQLLDAIRFVKEGLS